MVKNWGRGGGGKCHVVRAAFSMELNWIAPERLALSSSCRDNLDAIIIFLLKYDKCMVLKNN